MPGNYERMKQAVGQKPLKNHTIRPANPPAKKETPAVRDEEMEKKGRFPNGTRITADYADFQWEVTLWVPDPSQPPPHFWSETQTGSSVHKLLTVLYRKWLEAGKPGDKP